MTQVFVDAFFYIALLDASDAFHQEANEYFCSNQIFGVTTEWVLAETADAFSASHCKAAVGAFIRRLESATSVRIVRGAENFQSGLALYEKRSDKDWSLTDCISFVVMSERGISEALTRDHHFEQAGFTAVFHK